MGYFDRIRLLGFVIVIGWFLHGCAPPTYYRGSGPSSVSRLARKIPEPPPSPAVSVPKERVETQKPILFQSDIREQDLERGRLARTTLKPALAPTVERSASPGQVPAEDAVLQPGIVGDIDVGSPSVENPPAWSEVASLEPAEAERLPSRPEEPSLIAMIAPNTPPRSALSLRLTEEGRKFLQTEEYARGLAKLEKAISLDSRNRFAYYFLAEAHYALGQHEQSLNFLEIVQSRFAGQPVWLGRVHALRGMNYESLGFFEKADESYVTALELDPRNPIALQGISEMRWATPAPPR